MPTSACWNANSAFSWLWGETELFAELDQHENDDHRRDDVGAFRRHEPRCLVVDQSAVFDAANAKFDAAAHGMRGTVWLSRKIHFLHVDVRSVGVHVGIDQAGYQQSTPHVDDAGATHSQRLVRDCPNHPALNQDLLVFRTLLVPTVEESGVLEDCGSHRHLEMNLTECPRTINAACCAMPSQSRIPRSRREECVRNPRRFLRPSHPPTFWVVAGCSSR